MTWVWGGGGVSGGRVLAWAVVSPGQLRPLIGRQPTSKEGRMGVGRAGL